MKKTVAIAFCVTMAFLFGCTEVDPEQTENYRLGYDAGYDAAWTEHQDDYDDGYENGYENGYEEGVQDSSWTMQDIQNLIDDAKQEGYERGYEDAWYDMEHGNPNMMETDPSDPQVEVLDPADIGE